MPRDEPALVGLRGSEVWLQWVDRRAEPILNIASGPHGDAAVALLDAGAEPHVISVGRWLLVSLGPGEELTGALHILATRDGEVAWWRIDDARPDHLSPNGDLLFVRITGSEIVDATGEATLIEGRFTARSATDVEGWLMGSGGPIGGHGFFRRGTGEVRALGAGLDSGLTPIGTPSWSDGKYYYVARDADGKTSAVREGPTAAEVHSLEGLDEDSEFHIGATHMLIMAGEHPLALFARTDGEFVALEGQPLQTSGLEWVYDDGSYFVSIDRSRGERRFRVNTAIASVDMDPIPPFPDGLSIFGYSGCSGYSLGRGAGGRVTAMLGDGRLGDETPVQLHLESADGTAWTPLGRPVVFGIGHYVVPYGQTLMVTTGDVRDAFCQAPPSGEPSELGDGTLVGQSLQLIRPDAEPLVFHSGADGSGHVPHVRMSPGGSCALAIETSGPVLYNLVTSESQVVELERPRWLDRY